MFQKHKALLPVLLIIIIFFIAVIVLSFVPGSTPGRSILADIFSGTSGDVKVSQLLFEVGRNRDYAHTGGFVASAGTLGLQVLDSYGRETLRESFRMSQPALIENNGRFLSFDVGDKALRIFNTSEILVSMETDGIIVSASINKNGWFCLVTQEPAGGARATIGVYNSDGREIYRVIIGSSFILSAGLSDDNKNLTLLSIADTGSKLMIYRGIDTDKKSPDDIIELGSGIFIDMIYLSNTRLLLIGAGSAVVVNTDSESPVNILFDYTGNRLGDYTYTATFLALHIFDYTLGVSGQIISIDFNGNVLGQLPLTQEVLSISAFKNTLILLDNEGLSFYGSALNPQQDTGPSIPSGTAGRVLALSEDLALIANDLSVNIIRCE